MNRVGKNMRMTAILLAGLVILLHSVITHHHHSDLSTDHFSSVNNANQVPGESSDEANKHCHAFNNIITEKVTSKTFNIKIEPDSNLILISVFNTFSYTSNVESATYVIWNLNIVKQYFSTVLSFRGPPTLL
jgi:hypothetical protein